MTHTNIIKADLDEIVFEGRNQDYGAYQLRKNSPKFLRNAMIISFTAFVLIVLIPRIATLFEGEEELTIVEENVVPKVVTLEEIKEIPPEAPVQPPPKVDMPPPKRSAIEYKVPEPAPDEEVPEDVTIHEIDSIKTDNIGAEDVEGDPDVGYDFGEIGGTGTVEVIEEPPKADDPDPNAFVLLEEQPQAVNMDDIKQLIGYPPAAKEAGIEGKVVLRILINKSGKYQKHIVLKNPHPLLTKSVEKHVHNLSFTPGIQGGKPIPVWVTIPFDFKLVR